jgi:methylmalonyl-CoA/ethylmalonyl-CoA epimerase
MMEKLDHIGIAVRNMEKAVQTYTQGFGLAIKGTEVVEDQKVSTTFLALGDTYIELLESTSPDGPIAKFIEKRGEGIHHLCFKVENIKKALEACKAQGMQLIDAEPRKGAHDKWIAFVHPKSTHGVLIELSQDP